VLGLPRGGVPVAYGVSQALGEVDEVICADTPGHFIAVGERYDDFRDTSDEEIRALLADAKAS